jgi:hypothetical protein
MGTPNSFDQSNVLENRKHIFNSIKLSSNNNNKNEIQLSSDFPLQKGKKFLNLENDMQLNVPDKVTTPQQPTNTTSGSTQGWQRQQLTADTTLTILEGGLQYKVI